MTDHSSTDRAATDTRQLNRRQVLGVGTGVGVTLLAGCTGGSNGGTGSDGSTGSDDGSTAGETGSFRLLISDQPVAIGDFDSLNVSFDSARIFKSGEEEDDQATNETETDDDQAVETRNETNGSEMDDEDEPRDASEDDDSEEDDEAGGFSTIDLGGATVDLTQVVGEKAIGVFDGELEAGRYSKIELYASNVAGVVDGDSVDVKIPSGKLQLTKPFEVTPDEPVSFVFDINVVKKGNKAAYNLLPVISESGVAGKDVDVEEVEEEDDADDREGGEEDDETNSTADGDTNSTADGDTNSTAQGGTQTTENGQ